MLKKHSEMPVGDSVSRSTNRSLIDLEKRFKQECDDLLVSLHSNWQPMPGLEPGPKEFEEARYAIQTEYASRRELPSNSQ